MKIAAYFPALPSLMAASILLLAIGPGNGQEMPQPSPGPVVTGEATPAPANANQGTDSSALEGEHRCRGRNPDGTNYQGLVTIRVKDGLFLMEWDINGKKSYGTGLLQGTTLGVGLDDGTAIYKVVPQPQGISLIGLWAVEGAKEACHETILLGDADQTTAKFPAPGINGVYRAVTLNADGTKEETPFSISGKDTLKYVKLKDGTKAEGLQLGDGLAVITPTGLAVFQIGQNQNGNQILSGRSFDQTAVREVTLVPYE
ncbi:hypothetical protein BH09VER1_BH09VER1_30850 [soil metagenome]